MWKKILKFFLYLLIITLISGVVIGGFLFLDRTIEEAVLALVVIFGIWITIIVVRKLIIRYRAKEQVKRILQAERAESASDLGMSAKELTKDLRKRWKKAIGALRKSQLKLRGDPLYVLPWYMVVGKPRSGKSTALKNSRLLSPEIDLPERLDGSTLNLEWWLYEQAIVIDTAGRYAVPDEDKRDRKEWATMLSMLSRHKQKEPINGLVLVVAADRLLNDSSEQLAEEGRQVRASINELMDKLEVQVPVYLMVTKCDLIEGFSDWCSYLPDDALLQAMGYLHEETGGDIDQVIDKGLDAVTDRMKDMRLLMLERSQQPGDSLLQLPVTLEKVREGLHHFVQTALKENPFQDTPLFRGLYFSSSQQYETGKEHIEENLNNNGRFLHEIFTRVMPRDRGLMDSLPSAERFRRAMRNYSAGIGGVSLALVLLFMSVVYNNDKQVLAKISSEYTKFDLQKNGISEQMHSLNRLRELIIDLSKAQESWIIPWTGHYGASAELEDLTERYIATFKAQVLDKADEELRKNIKRHRGEKTSGLAGGLIRRINLLKTRLVENPDEYIEDKPAVKAKYLQYLNKKIEPDAANLFNDLYVSYLNWMQSKSLLKEEKESLQVALVRLIEKNHGDYSWVIHWANSQGINSVLLENYWSGSLILTDPPVIAGAYTLEGKEFIQTFLDEFDEANDGANRMSKIKKEFEKYYRRNYLKSWETFASRFDEGKEMLDTRKEWLDALEIMSTRDNPYFNFMQRATKELKPFEDAHEFPSKTHIAFFDEMQNFEGEGSKKGKNKLAKKALKLVGKFGKAGKAISKAGKQGMKANKKAKKLKGKSKEELDSSLKEAAKILVRYKKSMDNLVFDAESLEKSHTAMSTLFTPPYDPGAGGGDASAAWNSIVELQKLIGRKPSTRIFWDLYMGPLKLAHDFMQQESSCYVQQQWENKVLAETEGVGESNLGNMLIGETGLLWNFIDTDAKAYLVKRNKKGYLPAKVKGRNIKWSEKFMTFVNQAASGRLIVGNEYVVNIKTLPTGVNQGAAISPYATYLTLRCADEVQKLANYNYSGSQDFKWSLEKCGEVKLQIDIGHITLTKLYTGEKFAAKNQKGIKGFGEFLDDFRDGHYVFVAEDFPNQTAQLLNENVKTIDVNYEIHNQEPVLQANKSVPLDLPEHAAACWL